MKCSCQDKVIICANRVQPAFVETSIVYQATGFVNDD